MYYQITAVKPEGTSSLLIQELLHCILPLN
jgi:hypothetical protein